MRGSSVYLEGREGLRHKGEVDIRGSSHEGKQCVPGRQRGFEA